MKKLISLLLAVFIAILSGYSAGAYTKPGPTEWDMEMQYLAESKNVKISDGSIIAENGGYVLFDYFAEIDTEKIVINYKDAKSASIVVLPEESDAKSFTLNPEEAFVTYDFAVTQRRGDNRLRIDFKGSVTVASIRFYAKHLSFTPGQMTTVFSENEDAIATAVAVKEDSHIIMVRGARRYVDDENIDVKALNFDGSLYLPIKTLAYAFGYYHEELPDKNFCLMRNEQDSFVYRDGQSTYQAGHKEPQPASFVPKLIDGRFWLPVRFFAEASGKTVVFKDGIAVADSRIYANKIINDKEIFGYLSNKFEGFMGERTVGKTYFVAQTFNANDENPGTMCEPFRTLEKAAEVAKAGDTVLIREGVYRETLNPKNDGTELSPITFKAYKDEKVVISANEVINNFVDNGKGVAMSKVSWDLGLGRNQIFYKDDCIIEARYPNGPRIEMSENGEPLSDLFPVRGEFLIPDDNDSIVTSKTLLNQEEKDYWKDAIYMSMHGLGYTLASAVVESSEKGLLHLKDKCQVWWYAPERTDKMDWGYLSGSINCMDLPGEWVIQDGILLMLPPNGEKAETLVVEMKKRQLTVDLEDRKFIRVEGINTIGGSANLKNSEMCILNRMNMKYISHFTWCDDWREGYISGYSPDNVKAGKSTLINGEVGIHIGGRDNKIMNSVIDHSAGAGVISTGLYGYIENNIVSNCGYMGNYVSGITLYREGSTPPESLCGGDAVFNNTVYNCGRNCFVVQSPEGLGYPTATHTRQPRIPYEIAYNDFHDGILFSLDTGITYEYATNASTERLMSSKHHNYVYYTLPETNPFSFGLYLDGYATGIDNYDNIIFCTEKGTIFTGPYLFRNAAYSPCWIWNNMQLEQVAVPGGPKGLKIEHFPYALPFYAGSRLGAEPFMKNYENQQESAFVLRAAEANLSEGVTVDENDSAQLNGKGQYIEFKDVDFGEEGKNTVDIYFRGDCFGSTSTIKIGFGESVDTAVWDTIGLLSQAEETYQLDVYTENFNKITGKTNVYIMAESHKEIDIEGVVFTMNENYKDSSHDGARVNAAEFDIVDKMGERPPRSDKLHEQNITYAGDTWGGTVLRYLNVNIPENAKVLYVNTSCGSPYHGGTITFGYCRKGDPSDTILGTVTVPDNGWGTYDQAQYIVLDKEVPAETVDITVSFTDGDTPGGKTCDFYCFGFLSEIPE